MYFSYQERNHWICVLISIWATTFYFWKGLSLEGGLNADIELYLPIIARVVIYSIVGGIVLAIVNSCFNRDKHVERDERDRLIEFKGYRNGFWVFSGLLWMLLIGALFNERASRGNWDSALQLDTINLLIHSLFLVSTVAGLVQSFTHIIFYRKGAA